ncbi:zinc finger BED domain-containing protein 3 [Ornithorhynchus anatinus]|uniref:Zinc finger BED-type containing 3 n=1 Tax=Ornithorhynchus anatinus TaxID=9258 RepID=F7G3I7_ORNAN|nr:zinc finger BED domain-containing protein 3 [Ornithorhynchus anatinus]XP_028920888.1 zinc finger BED domain-containing protein 3 [Ornithorhynchus anatinus]XP_028920896.1 zinc finger BED domain-containing protein 3 [Ornithorhynchus anatinus]XP_028920900.1 zinc finger BED domain-containing protein 3 [Ornithorhynchus anatinus]
MEEQGLDPGVLGLTGPAPLAHGRGARYSEAWEYFHLATARSGHPASQYATCRLCGKQVSRGPGFNVGTTALWKHLKSMHKQELEKSGQQSSPHLEVAAPALPQPLPRAEGDWGQLVEQMGALATRGSQREREVERREREMERRERAVERREWAVEWRERAVELRRRAVEEEERALATKMQELRVEREELQARLLEACGREIAFASAPAPLPAAIKEEEEEEEEEDNDNIMESHLVTRVLV